MIDLLVSGVSDVSNAKDLSGFVSDVTGLTKTMFLSGQ